MTTIPVLAVKATPVFIQVEAVPEAREAPRAVAAVEAAIDLVIGLKAWFKSQSERRSIAHDAMALRSYAMDLRASQPSLAADLMAAADRSQGGR
jgi:hypothetical protein